MPVVDRFGNVKSVVRSFSLLGGHSVLLSALTHAALSGKDQYQGECSLKKREHTLEQAKQVLRSINKGEPMIATFEKEEDGVGVYGLVVFVRTIADFTSRYIHAVQLKMYLPERFPSVSPRIVLYKTTLFHPNFSADGIWLANEIRFGDRKSVV